MSYRPAAKKQKLEGLQEQIHALVDKQHQELQQQKAALRVAMNLVCDIAKIPCTWEEMPTELRNDSTAVTQAIVSGRFILRRSHIPESVLQDLLPNLLQHHRSAAIEACKEGILKWEEVNPTPDEWRQSEEMSLHALRLGLVREDLADAPTLTRDVLRDAVQSNQLRWEHIPTHLQSDQDFCRSIVSDNSSYGGRREDPVAVHVFDRHPQLLQDREVWGRIIGSRYTLDAYFTIETLFERGHLPSDADLMQQACACNESVLRFIDQLRFSDIVRNMVHEDAKNLIYVRRQFIDAFQDFVASKLADFCAGELNNPSSTSGIRRLAEKIPDRLWNTDEFANTWFEVGLPLLSLHPQAWKADRQKLLMVAERSPTFDWTSLSFGCASDELRDDAAFITQAMQFDPCLLEYASETLRTENFELAMWALGEPRFVDRCRDAIAQSGRMQWGRPMIIFSEAKLEEFRARAVDELTMHSTFVNPFLCGVHLSEESNIHCQLWKLNHRSLLEAIGEFVGIPGGNHLRNIRRALDNYPSRKPSMQVFSDMADNCRAGWWNKKPHS